MLKLVTPSEHGTLEPSVDAPRIVDHVLTVEVPPRMPALTMRVALSRTHLSGDLAQIVRARPHLREVMGRMDQLMTCIFPGPGGQGMLLRDVVGAATRAFYVAPAAKPGLDAARFIAAAVSSAARGLLAFRVTLLTDKAAGVEWNLMGRESLRYAIDHCGATKVRFDATTAPTAATVWAAKTVVLGSVCRFEDLVLMESVGVDYRTHDAL